MSRTLFAAVLCITLPLPLIACLWDRDTPESEARGLPEVVAVLTGRFDRNPPLFYEMRLKRVAALLASHADDLAAYDDAGVACDRLARGDEAVEWMRRKYEKLSKLDSKRKEVREHLYRHHANLGTFLAHRRLRNGADRSKLDQVRTARDHIAKALEINPDAHFGRERYQLMALDFLIDPPKVAGEQYLPNLLHFVPDDIYGEHTTPAAAHDAVRGLTGLIVLGDAWQSIDAFNALNIALQRDSVGFRTERNGGRNSLAYFAWLRCLELADAGKSSLLPDAPRGPALKPLFYKPGFVRADLLLDPTYKSLRSEADARNAARNALMLTRLKSGLHPDTHPDFWQGYVDPPAPRLPTRSVPDAFYARQKLHSDIARAVPLTIIAVLSWFHIRRKRKHTAPALS